MPTSELPYGAIKILVALTGVAGAGSLMMWLCSGTDSTIRSWEIVRANQQDAVSRKQYQDAETLGRQAVRLAERLGSSNYRVAISHEDLGLVLGIEKKSTEARKNFDDAEKILSTSVIRAKDAVNKRMLLADLSSAQRNLGLVELEDGNADLAAKNFSAAISNLDGCLRDVTSGRLDLFIAHRQVDLFCRLAQLNLKQGKKAEAEKLFRKAVGLADESFYPAFLIKPVKEQFASMLETNGNKGEARALFSHDRWVNFTEAAETAKSQQDMAGFAKNLRSAADAAKNSKSTMHLAVISLKRLAKLYLQQSNIPACKETCIEALSVWKTLGGGADSEADYVMGILIRLAHNKDIAIEVQSSRLKLRRDLYGQKDFHVGETETDLATLYLENGDGKTAKIYANQAYDTFNQLRLKRRGNGVEELSLGKVLEQSLDLSRAETMYSRALAAQMKRHKKNASMVGEIYERLSAVYRKQGKESKSQSAFKESLRWRSYANGR